MRRDILMQLLMICQKVIRCTRLHPSSVTISINVWFSSASSHQPLCSLTCLGLMTFNHQHIWWLCELRSHWSNVPFDFFLIMNLTEICDNAKKGREYALLGNYDSSMVYYQGVIQQIHKHCQSLRDPALKVKWQQVRCSYTVGFNLICTYL